MDYVYSGDTAIAITPSAQEINVVDRLRFYLICFVVIAVFATYTKYLIESKKTEMKSLMTAAKNFSRLNGNLEDESLKKEHQHFGEINIFDIQTNLRISLIIYSTKFFFYFLNSYHC